MVVGKSSSCRFILPVGIVKGIAIGIKQSRVVPGDNGFRAWCVIVVFGSFFIADLQYFYDLLSIQQVHLSTHMLDTVFSVVAYHSRFACTLARVYYNNAIYP